MSKKQIKQSKQALNKRHSAIPPSVKSTATLEKPKAEQAAVMKSIEAPVVVAKATNAGVTPAVTAASTPIAVSSPSERALQLINQLRDLDADVASDAATQLGALGEAFAVPALIQVVENSEGYYHSVVRAAASSSLGLLKDARAVDVLVIGTRDEMAEASAEAVRALASIGDARAVDSLVEIVRNTDGFYVPVVRLASVIALAKLGGAAAKAELAIVAANESEDPVVRQAAQSK